ncbi:MAG: DUF4142 domain-containing protein [Sphingomonas sp.]|nr:DUF4142 domain-containing protein [Sphingomonas sp.]
MAGKQKFFVLSAALFGVAAIPASATLPTPPQDAATRDAQAYLFYGGAGDIFEISTSMAIIQKSANPQVRAFATNLIAGHTQLSSTALATAAGAGITPPPPEMTADQKAMITQLLNASPANLDRTYLQQQVPAHQQALSLQRGYSRSGDNAALRQAASAAVPVIEQHLAAAQQLLGSVR